MSLHLAVTTVLICITCEQFTPDLNYTTTTPDRQDTVPIFPHETSSGNSTTENLGTLISHNSSNGILTDNSTAYASTWTSICSPSNSSENTSLSVSEICSPLNIPEETLATRSCMNPHCSSDGGSRGTRDYGGYLSKDEYEFYMSIIEPIRFSLHIIATPLLLLTVVSFARDMVSVSNKFILFINVFEFACSAVNVVWMIMKYILGPTHKVLVLFLIASTYCIVCFRRIVYIFNLVLSAQRLFAVARPIKSRYANLDKVTTAVLVGIPIFVVINHIYLALTYTVMEIISNMFVQNSSTHTSKPTIIAATTDIYNNNEALFESYAHFSKTAFSYVPLVLTLGINLILLGFLKLHSEKLKTMRTIKDGSERSRKDRQMTLMILVSTLSYTILSLPPNINTMLSAGIDSYNTQRREHYLFSVIKAVVNVSQTIGDLTNFISYVCLSSGFRHHLMNTLLPGRRTA